MARTADTSQLIQYLVTSLVDDPDSVSIERRDSDGSIAYGITVHPDDVGKVIGRQGRIIKAIRILARAAGSVNRDRIDVDVIG